MVTIQKKMQNNLALVSSAKAPGVSLSELQSEYVMRVETVAEQLLFSTIRIETEKFDEKNNPVVGVGTGFIVEYNWNNKTGVFLVTKKNVLERATKVRFFLFKATVKIPSWEKLITLNWRI